MSTVICEKKHSVIIYGKIKQNFLTKARFAFETCYRHNMNALKTLTITTLYCSVMTLRQWY